MYRRFIDPSTHLSLSSSGFITSLPVVKVCPVSSGMALSDPRNAFENTAATFNLTLQIGTCVDCETQCWIKRLFLIKCPVPFLYGSINPEFKIVFNFDASELFGETLLGPITIEIGHLTFDSFHSFLVDPKALMDGCKSGNYLMDQLSYGITCDIKLVEERDLEMKLSTFRNNSLFSIIFRSIIPLSTTTFQSTNRHEFLINNPSNLTFTIQGTKTSDFDTV
jgi:hypothetical protein